MHPEQYFSRHGLRTVVNESLKQFAYGRGRNLCRKRDDRRLGFQQPGRIALLGEPPVFIWSEHFGGRPS